MRKFRKVTYLTTTLVVSGTAAAIAVSGVIASPASAATGPSAACTAATQTYNAALQTLSTSSAQSATAEQNREDLQDQVNPDNAVIAQYNKLEAQETYDVIFINNARTWWNLALHALDYDDPPALLFFDDEIATLNNALRNTENQLNALDGQFRQANREIFQLTGKLNNANAKANALTTQVGDDQYAAEKAQEAEASACQGMTTPTATPTTPAATPTATPSGTSSGSTQQYSQNGFDFVNQEITLISGSESAQAWCTGVANSTLVDPGQAGSSPEDTGPTAADQAAWISGCMDGYPKDTGAATGSPAPAATTPAATTPAATTDPATTPAATTPAATTPAATTPAATTPAATTPAATTPAATPGRV
jgi:hypothetical protein